MHFLLKATCNHAFGRHNARVKHTREACLQGQPSKAPCMLACREVHDPQYRRACVFHRCRARTLRVGPMHPRHAPVASFNPALIRRQACLWLSRDGAIPALASLYGTHAAPCSNTSAGSGAYPQQQTPLQPQGAVGRRLQQGPVTHSSVLIALPREWFGVLGAERSC